MVYQYYLTLLLKGLKMKLSLFVITQAIRLTYLYYVGIDIDYQLKVVYE